MKYNRMQVAHASAMLSVFVAKQAHRLMRATGIQMRPCNNAPNSYGGLVAAFMDATMDSERYYLPVSNLHCWSTIYTTPEVNMQFRYWHDMLHCMRREDFSLKGELAIGALHCGSAAREFGRGSLEYKLMLADTIGQTVHEAMTGAFPGDQREFCFNFVNQ